VEAGTELLAYWLMIVLLALSFTLGYYMYVALKRRFDSIYNEPRLLPKRVIHGIVYVIFLILMHEGVRLRLGNPSVGVELIILLVLVAIGTPIFIDIIFSLYRLLVKVNN